MDGFGNSKDRKKHFKKHVGAPGTSFGSGDMHNMFPDEKAYESAGVGMFGQPPSAPGMVEIAPAKRKDSVMRWNTQTNQFAAGDPQTRRLSTFHVKTPDQFLKAVSEQAPEALPRTISFAPAAPPSPPATPLVRAKSSQGNPT